VALAHGGAQVNKQQESFSEEKREEVANWILRGQAIYQDDIEIIGDWVHISVYLPE